jgi:hypothetical protein
MTPGPLWSRTPIRNVAIRQRLTDLTFPGLCYFREREIERAETLELLKVFQTRVRDSGVTEAEPSEPFEFLEVLQPRVRDLGAVEVEIG